MHSAKLLTTFVPHLGKRAILFGVAVAVLGGLRLLQSLSRKRGRPFLDSVSTKSLMPSTPRLLLASFLTLFAELAFIRWIAVEVRIFAYFKNLALLLCFVGFGLGCALVRKPLRWESSIKAFLGLLFVVRMPWLSEKLMETLSQDLGGASGTQIWNTANATNWGRFLTSGLLALLLFLLLVLIFIPLGQLVSGELNLTKRRLSAYSWNLLGSLAGILVFVTASRLMLPPWFWLGLIMVGFALLQGSLRDRTLLSILVIPLILMLYEPHTRDHFVLWTPYHQIDYTRMYSQRNGDFAAGNLQVNHTYYQRTINLSDSFLARHPGLEPRPEQSHYNLPFRFAKAAPKVLIVGAGTGNDASAALRYGSSSVDAVEIDPAILDLGRREHPEHPYSSPRVEVHLNDARAFLKRTATRYDLIVFALLDSHTQLSDFSNMRIDNFVYTEESILEAKAHLTDDGVLFLKFQTTKPWMVRRIAELMQNAFNKSPLVFDVSSDYSGGAGCFVVSTSDRIQNILAHNPGLAELVSTQRIEVSPESVPVTTDDWPYLYQQERQVPYLYLFVSILVAVLATILYLRIPGTSHQLPSPFFFFMGAGFMLLETQTVSRLALYFGMTWQVNAVVLSALLISLLASNMIAEKYGRRLPRTLIVGGLFLGLAFAYLTPFSRIPAQPGTVGLIASGILAVPVFFAGLLFSKEFDSAESPSAALGANILGAVLGGLLENASLVIGMRALLLLTMLLYAVAVVTLLGKRKWGTGPPATSTEVTSLASP